MVFIHDTRDQPGKHKNLEEWMEREGHTLVRSKMYDGDIALLHDQSVCIDLKGGGMQEVYSNIVQSHERFRRECIRAAEAEIQLIILVEDKNLHTLEDVKDWKNPRYERWWRENGFVVQAIKAGKLKNHPMPKSPVPSSRLMGMMDAMEQRYSVKFMFCHPQKVGETVFQILTEGK